MSSNLTPAVTVNTIQKIFLVALAGFSLFFFLFQLGKLPLYDYDEARYAEVVKETLSSDNRLTFKLRNKESFEKPPLLLWLTMGSVKFIGESEFAMRLPAALFGVAAIWGTYFLARLLTKNYWAALGAGFVLLFSGIFPASGRQLRFDVPLSAAIVFAIHNFVKGWEQPKWYLGFWVWTALGLLVKSAPALFIGPVALVFSAVYGRWGWLKSVYFWLGVPLFFAVAAPWHIYETVKFGSQFWNNYFGYQIFQRATRQILGGGSTNWDYFKHFLFLNEPWFFLIFVVLGFLLVYRSRKMAEWRASFASILSGAFIFFVFAVAKTKLMFYLVPVLPFEALSIASGSLFIFRSSFWHYKKEIFAVLGAAVFLFGAASTSYQLFYSNMPYSYPFIYDEREIGRIIKQFDRGHKLYSFDWLAHDTIYYYSGKGYIQSISRDDLKTGFPPPYFMIMPRPYFAKEDQPGVKVLYKGKFLVLLETELLRPFAQ